MIVESHNNEAHQRREAEVEKLRAERNRFYALLSLTERAIMDDAAAITFQSFGQYREWLLRVMRGKMHNNEGQ